MKTTKAQFRQFVNECQKWIRVFGLNDWFIRFSHTDEYHGTSAHCSSFTDSRECTINLSVDIGDEPLPYELSELALEEVLHIATADMKMYVNGKDREEFTRLEHILIARIINAIYPHRKAICGK